MKTFIGSDNVYQFAKVQSANSYGSEREVVILWDDLTRKQRSIAENIDIDVEVHTSNPGSVPDKWSESIVEVSGDITHLEIIKIIVSNPDREDVFDLLCEEDPPEPLMLWWLSHTIPDAEYMRRMADVCHYGLFQSDTTYLWGVSAFGVGGGIGKFSWPESTGGLPDEEQEVFDDILEEYDIREKELRLCWDDVKGEARVWTDDAPEAEAGGGSSAGGQTSLFDV